MKTTQMKQKLEVVNKFMGIKEWVLIIVLSIMWGGSFFFVGVAVKELPPFTIVLFRVAFASIILFGYSISKGRKNANLLEYMGLFFCNGCIK